MNFKFTIQHGILRRDDSKVSLRRTVPDSATTWVITALTIDPTSGLAISKPANVNVSLQRAGVQCNE